MKSAEGPESSTAKPKLPSERSVPAAPEPEWPPCPGARPGPARWGPLGPRPPGGRRGRPTWGAAQPRSPEIAEPGNATAAARRRERSGERGGGRRLLSPGLRKSANYFQRTQTFLFPLLAAVPLALESFSGFPRGRRDAIASPGFLGGGSANFVDSGTRSARPAAEPRPRCSGAPEDRDPGTLASGKGSQLSSLGSGCGALHTYCRTGASGLTKAEPRPPGLAPRRGVPWAGKRQVCQASVACWIGERPPQQRVPLALSTLGGQPWTQDCSVAELSGPGSWLLRPVRRGIKVWASAPCVSTRAAALWEEDRAESRGLLRLLVSVAALSLRRVSGKRRERRGHRGAPADAPPAASQAAPPRGDEALAVKMEVTCLLLLALIPFHCRGQGVYGKSQRPAPPWRSHAETLQDLAQSTRCRGSVEPWARTLERMTASPPSPGRRETEQAASEPKNRS